MASLREAAEKLSQRQENDSKLEESFSDIEKIETGPVIKEEKLRKTIEPVEPGKVAGVDGGIVKKRYSSADLIAVRAVSAIFNFKGSKLEEADYKPEKSPEPEFNVIEPQDQNTLERKAEEERLKAETEVALNSAKDVDTVMMDGSIVPTYSDSEEVMEKYNRLFGLSDEGSLVGVVEDSYGQSLTEILEEKTGLNIGRMRDTKLMDLILSEGERSLVRKYSKGPAEHPVLKKMTSSHVNKIHTFYVKLSEKDQPLRIDYYGEVEDADEIAGKLLNLKSSERYTVPSPVLEADRKAKIPEKYLKRIDKRLPGSERRRERRII